MPMLKYKDPGDGQWKPVPVGGSAPNEVTVSATQPTDGSELWLDTVASPPVASAPSGMIAPFAGTSAPAGWLIADGTAVSRTTYAALFAVCGVAYGVGDGSTTFNLPNLKGKVPTGVDAAQTEFNLRAKTGGAKTHVHYHSAQIGTISGVPAWLHVDAAEMDSPGSYNPATNHAMAVGSLGTGSAATVTKYIVTSSAENGLPPYLALNYIVKT